jgi:hypothetical protein
MRRIFDQRPDVHDPLRMSARKLTELNDRILVHEKGERVQPPFCGPCFQSEEKRGARFWVSHLGKHDSRQIPHCDLPVREKGAKLKRLDPGGDGDPQRGFPQRLISGKKPKSDQIRCQRMVASGGGLQEVPVQTFGNTGPAQDCLQDASATKVPYEAQHSALLWQRVTMSESEKPVPDMRGGILPPGWSPTRDNCGQQPGISQLRCPKRLKELCVIKAIGIDQSGSDCCLRAVGKCLRRGRRRYAEQVELSRVRAGHMASSGTIQREHVSNMRVHLEYPMKLFS